jgi:hypothetical protein
MTSLYAHRIDLEAAPSDRPCFGVRSCVSIPATKPEQGRSILK